MKGSLLRIAVVFVGALPWIAALGAPFLPRSLTRAIELAFAALCHHVPERTLVVHGHAMCVCSRCAGFYAGITLAALGSWSRAETPVWRVVLWGGGAFMIADIVTQDLGIHAPWHPSRVLSGAVVGFAAVAWLLASFNGSRRGSLAPSAPPL